MCGINALVGYLKYFFNITYMLCVENIISIPNFQVVLSKV